MEVKLVKQSNYSLFLALLQSMNPIIATATTTTPTNTNGLSVEAMVIEVGPSAPPIIPTFMVTPPHVLFDPSLKGETATKIIIA